MGNQHKRRKKPPFRNYFLEIPQLYALGWILQHLKLIQHNPLLYGFDSKLYYLAWKRADRLNKLQYENP